MALSVGVVDRVNLERKGHRPFVGSARHLPDVEFVLAGKWSDDAIAQLRTEAGPNVTFTGYLDDEALDDYFVRAAVYVQPSQHEGFGLSVAEAMLARCVPVVTAAVPAAAYWSISPMRCGGMGSVTRWSSHSASSAPGSTLVARSCSA
jgi:glycosyltransferase involved in cell wall biosynthesis